MLKDLPESMIYCIEKELHVLEEKNESDSAS